jgi:hypothetical protein
VFTPNSTVARSRSASPTGRGDIHSHSPTEITPTKMKKGLAALDALHLGRG